MPRRNKSRVDVLQVLPVFRPAMGQEEIDAVAEVIRSGWIGLGPKTEDFEKKFSDYVDAGYSVGLNSATAALHLSLLALGIGKGDDVLVPSLTFVSTAHVVFHVGARPVFVDVDEETLCMDPGDLEKKATKKSKAVIPVHYGGHPADLDEIHQIARRNDLRVIEDASHACGSTYKRKKIGGLSDLTCFSFHAVKNLATGDGGMVTTNDRRLAEKIRRLRWMGINQGTWAREELVQQKGYRQYGWYYEVTDLGYKCHMNDLNAAIGLVQLGKLANMNARRTRLADRYDQALGRLRWLRTPVYRPYVRSAKHNYVVRTEKRDQLNVLLKQKMISSGVHYFPVHLHPYYRKHGFRADVPVTERVWKTLLTLPLYPTLSFADQDRVINAIVEFGQSS